MFMDSPLHASELHAAARRAITPELHWQLNTASTRMQWGSRTCTIARWPVTIVSQSSMSSSTVRSARANNGHLQVLRIRNVSNSGRLAPWQVLLLALAVVALMPVVTAVVTARPTPPVVTNLVLTLPASVEGPDRALSSFGTVCIPTGGTCTRSIRVSILSITTQHVVLYLSAAATRGAAEATPPCFQQNIIIIVVRWQTALSLADFSGRCLSLQRDAETTASDLTNL